MIRLAISVEGRTEEEFVKRVLAEHLRVRKVEATPILLGGNVTVTRLAADMARLCRSFRYVSSLVDYYGFRGRGSDTPDTLQQRINTEALGRIGQPPRLAEVFSYVQQYEFEALLFSEVSAFARALDASPSTVGELGRIRSHFSTPEDINDSFNTAPSRRIERVMAGYNKVVGGYMIAAEIGLAKIRAECRRFDSWLTRLESLA